MTLERKLSLQCAINNLSSGDITAEQFENLDSYQLEKEINKAIWEPFEYWPAGSIIKLILDEAYAIESVLKQYKKELL